MKLQVQTKTKNYSYKLNNTLWLLLFMYNIDFVNSHLLHIFNIPIVFGSIIHWIIYSFVVARWLKYSDKKSKLTTLKCFMILSIALSLSYLLNSNLRLLIRSNMTNIFIECLPYFAVAASIRDFDDLMLRINKVNVFSTILTLLIAFFSLSEISADLGYNYLSISYNMLIGVIINLYCVLNNKKIILGLLFLFEMIVLIIVGARGPLICVLVFLILYFFKTYKLYSLKALRIYFISINLLVFLMIFFTNLIEKLKDILQHYNIESRTIEKFLDGSIMQDSARNYIHMYLLEFVKLKPIIGYGIFADRLLNESINFDALRGTYTHNIFLEFAINYGIPAATILLFLLIGLTIKTYIKSSYNKSLLLSIIFSISFIRLLFTSSYIIEQYFYVLVGLLISMNNSIIVVRDRGRLK